MKKVNIILIIFMIFFCASCNDEKRLSENVKDITVEGIEKLSKGATGVANSAKEIWHDIFYEQSITEKVIALLEIYGSEEGGTKIMEALDLGNIFLALQYAYKYNYTEVALELIKSNALDIFAETYKERDDMKKIIGLLETGNINMQDENGYTALMYATKSNINLLELFDESGIDINKEDNNGFTALLYAITRGNLGIVNTLLENGGNVNDSSEIDKDVIVITLPREKRKDSIKEISKIIDADTNIIVLDSNLPVAILIDDKLKENEKKLNELQVLNCSVYVEKNKNKTPLMYASLLGNQDIVKTVINHGAEINFQDYSGKTALMYAILYNNVKVVQELVSQLADVNILDINGIDAFMIASGIGDNKMQEILIDTGSRINKKDTLLLTEVKITRAINDIQKGDSQYRKYKRNYGSIGKEDPVYLEVLIGKDLLKNVSKNTNIYFSVNSNFKIDDTSIKHVSESTNVIQKRINANTVVFILPLNVLPISTYSEDRYVFALETQEETVLKLGLTFGEDLYSTYNYSMDKIVNENGFFSFFSSSTIITILVIIIAILILISVTAPGLISSLDELNRSSKRG